MTQPSGGYDEARLQVSGHSSSPRGQIHIHSCPWNRGGTFLHTHTGSLHKDGISANATPHFYSFCPSPALPAFAASAVFIVFLFYFLPSTTCSLERHVRYLDALSRRRLNAAVIDLAVFLPLLVIPSLAVIVSSLLRFHLSSVRLFTKG